MKKTLLALAVVAITVSIFAIKANAGKKLTEDEVYELALKVSEEYPICPELLTAMAFYESSYNPMAKNGSCMGLMQISEKWHKDRMKRLGVDYIYDPLGNMRLAADYIMELEELWDDIAIVLMVYNGDTTAQRAYDGEADISAYATKILKLSEELERRHGK